MNSTTTSNRFGPQRRPWRNSSATMPTADEHQRNAGLTGPNEVVVEAQDRGRRLTKYETPITTVEATATRPSQGGMPEPSIVSRATKMAVQRASRAIASAITNARPRPLVRRTVLTVKNAQSATITTYSTKPDSGIRPLSRGMVEPRRAMPDGFVGATGFPRSPKDTQGFSRGHWDVAFATPTGTTSG
jgi:hypothetical protein